MKRLLLCLSLILVLLVLNIVVSPAHRAFASSFCASGLTAISSTSIDDPVSARQLGMLIVCEGAESNGLMAVQGVLQENYAYTEADLLIEEVDVDPSAELSDQAYTAGSPGVLSGNLIQIPIHVPVNICGNSIDVIGLLNPAFGNTCVNA